MQVFCSRLINNLGASRIQVVRSVSTQYIPHKKYEVSHGILHGQAVMVLALHAIGADGMP